MTKITDTTTIYWTWAPSEYHWLGLVDRPRAVWKTDLNGDVVIIEREPSFPIRHSKRMTIEDMDDCVNCVRCNAEGVPFDSRESRAYDKNYR